MAGEEITADKLNQLNPETDTRLSQAEHNILELYLENYFASKNTPFQGLFFDGFSDTNKGDTTTGNIGGAAAAGQKNVALANQTEVNQFAVGAVVEIYDSNSREANTVTGSTTGAVTDFTSADCKSADGFAYTEQDGSGYWYDDGVVSGKRRIRRTGTGSYGSGGDGGFLTKTLAVVNGATYRIQVTCNWNFPDSQAGKIQLLVDGALKQELNPLGYPGNGYATTGTISFDVNATASGATMTIALKCVQNSNFSAYNQDTADWSNFSVTHTGYLLIMQNNLLNSYAQGGYVKFTSATIDTANKKLAAGAGVGNGKYLTYLSKRQSFNQQMASAKLWFMRAVPVRFNPLAVLNNGDTQLTIKNLSIKSKYATGDTIEMSDGVNRERKTLTNVNENAGPVTLDGTATFGGGSGTFNVTDHSSQNQMLIVKAVNSNYLFRGSEAVTGVTVNGQTMIQLGGTQESSDGVHGSIWYLKNPPVGSVTINVSVNYGGSIMFAVENVYNAQAIDTYTGVVWGTSVTVADNNANDLVTDLAYSWNTGTINSGAGQTPDGNTVGDGPNCFKATYKTGANGNVTMAESGGSQTSFTIVAIIRQATPQATLTFAPAIQAAGFTTAANIDRVDVFPKISIVAKGASNNLQSPNFVQAVETVLTGNELMVEDEYEYQPNAAGNDLVMQMIITRSDNTTASYAKNLGVSLNT
jgi:hypothetical protein